MARAKFSLETRVAVVQHYLSGNGGGMRRTANFFGMHKSTVSQWVAAYQQHGIDGLTWKNDNHSFEFKLNVVRVIEQEGLSFREATTRFNISEKTVVSRWVKTYESSGEDGLRKLKRGKSKSVKKTNQTMTSPKFPPHPPEERSQEELLAELRYLRAEVAYLKKLKALVQEEKKQK